MTERSDQRKQIQADLERYLQDSCPASGAQKASDFSAETCNDAFLMLHQATSPSNPRSNP